MKIKVLYFALLKDITGIQEESIETNCSNVQCLKEQLEKNGGRLSLAL